MSYFSNGTPIKVEHPTDRPNFYVVNMNSADGSAMSIWFSYETPIALDYWDREGNQFGIIRENDWGPTTGKHLNYVNANHDARIKGDMFEELLRHRVDKALAQ